MILNHAVVYFDRRCLLLSLMFYRVLHLKQTSAYFVSPQTKDKFGNGKRLVVELVTRMVTFYLWLFSPFMTVAAVWIVLLEGALVVKVLGSFSDLDVPSSVKHFDYFSSVLGLCCLALAQVNLVLDYMVVLAFAHVCQLVSTTFIAFTVIIFLRLNQVNGLLLNQQQKSSSTTTITTLCLKTKHSKRWPLRVTATGTYELFYRLHNATCQIIFQVNETFGGMLLLFVGIMNPLSAYIVMSFILGRVPLTMLPFAGAIFTGQMLVLVGFQFVAAKYTVKIHLHWRLLLPGTICQCLPTSLAPSDTKPSLLVPCVRGLFRRSLYVEKFLVRRPYGITYGPLNFLVSKRSFAKVKTVDLIFKKFKVFCIVMF